MQYLGLAVLLFVSQSSFAEKIDPRTCRTIVDRDDRLACFDRAYFGDEDPLAPQQDPVEQSQKNANQRVQMTPSPRQTVKSVEAGSSSQRPEKQKKKRSLFSFPEQEVIESKITKMSNRNQQRMAFKLESGEIWVQSSPRNLPFKVGDHITIKSGRLGGFILRNQSGTTTRVVPAD